MQEIALPTNVVILCGHKQLCFSHFAAGLLFATIKRGEVLRTVTLADLSDPVRGAAVQATIDARPHRSLGLLVGARRKCQSEREDLGPETLVELLERGCVVASMDEER